ncbi:phosphoribosylformylglycinamidine cyclo-ligase [bacterium]|nr:phosphoribosylformylglycinamidine cyclo-ligase [bacterium]
MRRMTNLTYRESGVDIDKADHLKSNLKDTLKTTESRVLNSVGAFSSLYDISNLEGISHPVLCLKMEEPGTKQLLAAQHGKLPSVGIDLVNHLINDTVMNGGRPLAILDTIVCGALENSVVEHLVKEMVIAANNEGCSLVGGETSEQPRVLESGRYILSAACIGVVDKEGIIDGSTIQAGDSIFAVASNGVHTNGYTLIRTLLEREPTLADVSVANGSLIEAVLTPHRCYNTPLQEIFSSLKLNGLAHITGGGIVDNTKRILPDSLDGLIDLSLVEVLEVFHVLQQAGNIPESDMLRTFNCGVGMIFIGQDDACKSSAAIFERHGMYSYKIGEIVPGSGNIQTTNSLNL